MKLFYQVGFSIYPNSKECSLENIHGQKFKKFTLQKYLKVYVT